MKNLVKTVAIIAFTAGTMTFAKAQKIAHISLDSLITTMPESKTAQDVAQKYLKVYNDIQNEIDVVKRAFDDPEELEFLGFFFKEATGELRLESLKNENIF